jgi:hypothetical protein
MEVIFGARTSFEAGVGSRPAPLPKPSPIKGVLRNSRNHSSSVRAELVEALYFFEKEGRRGKAFDRLRPKG